MYNQRHILPLSYESSTAHRGGGTPHLVPHKHSVTGTHELVADRT